MRIYILINLEGSARASRIYGCRSEAGAWARPRFAPVPPKSAGGHPKDGG